MKNMLLESYKKNAWLFDRLLGEGTGTDEDEDIDLDSSEETEDEETEDDETTEDDGTTEDESDEIVDMDDLNDDDSTEGDLEDRIEALEDKVEALDHSDDDEEFEVDLANPVCPCCGARLNIKGAGNEDFAELAASITDEDELGEELDELPTDDDETIGEEITFADDDFLDKAGDDDEDYVDLTSMFDDDTEADDDEEA